MTRFAATAIASLLCGVLAIGGCGLKGDLYLPEEGPEVTEPESEQGGENEPEDPAPVQSETNG